MFKNDSTSEDSFTIKRLPNDVYSEYVSIAGVVSRLSAIAEVNPRSVDDVDDVVSLTNNS